MDFELWTRIGNKYNFQHILDPLACIRIYKETKSAGTEGKYKAVSAEERRMVLDKFGSCKKISYIEKIYDKITRGVFSRLVGLFCLIRDKYIYRRILAFNGKYIKFPRNIITQMFYNPMIKYFE
jgi:hypothetical protein